MAPRDPPTEEKTRTAVLHRVADMLSRQVTTDQLLKAMVDQVARDVDAERGTLFLVDAVTGELCSRVAHLPELKEIRLPWGRGVAGHVAMTGRPMLLPDASRDEHFFAGIDELTGFTTRDMLAVPVLDEDGAVRGVLQVLNCRHGSFRPEDTRLLEDLAGEVQQALARTSMRPCGDRRVGVLLDGPFNNIVGEAPVMASLYQRILAAAAADVTVLVRGDTGTGKSLVARAIHDNSRRAGLPLVPIDCTALPAGLIESELFGHERGAFTGADRRVQGKFEQAHGGTLFLDELGELPLPLQGKLLRFLQERQFERLGGRETLQADVRIVAATNADLEALVAQGRFRRDLYYRVRVVEIRVPTLAERGPVDVQRLSEHFLDLYARRHRRRPLVFGSGAMQRLKEHSWPGNVRELEHCIESAVVLAQGEVVLEHHLSLPGPEPRTPGEPGYPPGLPLEEVERDHIRRTLEALNGNRAEAARRLGIGRNTLARKLLPR